MLCVGCTTAWAASSPVQNAAAVLQHVIVIMQENRSFDSYFGTYPGADGIPMIGGVPGVCVTDPKTGLCVPPSHDAHSVSVAELVRMTNIALGTTPPTNCRAGDANGDGDIPIDELVTAFWQRATRVSHRGAAAGDRLVYEA